MENRAYDEDGLELELGDVPQNHAHGHGGPRCCDDARYILNHKGGGPFSDNPGKYTCVCYGKSYCPDHGIRCNGSHE